MPAVKDNANAVTHGKYSYLARGKAPKDARYVNRKLGEFKSAIDGAVVQKHGEITLYQAALIQSCLRHAGRAELLTRWLRLATEDGTDEKLSLPDRLRVLAEIGSASDSRDKVLKLLGLDAKSDADDVVALMARAQREVALEAAQRAAERQNAPGDVQDVQEPEPTDDQRENYSR